ncbi:hypothetical protein R7M92_12220 [Vibrio sp. Vb2880]|uniref:hypothetical protein n=1 Tax=Vibrio TaxID=662 RepID=UPI0029643D03|nr:hypothetical protein [Vibrio sp. Vb2880]MDW1576535.1 hypothetical protein [Vibrio sp. Vb2880]
MNIDKKTALGAIATLLLIVSVDTLAKEVKHHEALPCEVPKHSFSDSPTQAEFDVFSWKTFIALNQSASTSTRGEPAKPCKLPSVSERPVWLTYKDSQQVFLADGQDPGSWNDGYSGYGDQKGKSPFATSQIAKASANAAIKAHEEAVGGWLIDQMDEPTYFQMWVNETWYDYVHGNKLYDKANFDDVSSISFPNWSMEIKSAWRKLPEDNADLAKRYITQRAQVVVFDKEGNPIPEGDTGQYKTKPALLGLVGFHQIVKVPGFKQWIWGTFEHIDNVPPALYDKDAKKVVSQPEEGMKYTYFNAEASAKETNQPPCGLSNTTNCLPFTTPNPLARYTPIYASAAKLNSEFELKLKGTVLENYQLISTQWPTDPNNPSNPLGTPTPTPLANTTMESYIQSSSNCINCHSTATLPDNGIKADYSFLFFEAHSSDK